jgi:hypothetical protein
LLAGQMIPTIALGPDVVVRTENGIEIYTRLPMADWVISPHRPTSIRFHGDDFVLVEQRAPEDGGVCYVLQRSDPDAKLNCVGKTILYDLAYVRAREAELREQPLLASATAVLWCLAPLLGLAPSALQRRWHRRYGLHPQTITWASVGAECLVVICGALAITLQAVTFGGLSQLGAGWLVPVFGGASLLLVPDVVMRVSRLLGSGLWQYGFYEWLWHRLPAEE